MCLTCGARARSVVSREVDRAQHGRVAVMGFFGAIAFEGVHGMRGGSSWRRMQAVSTSWPGGGAREEGRPGKGRWVPARWLAEGDIIYGEPSFLGVTLTW